jgi:hypothetical protein
MRTRPDAVWTTATKINHFTLLSRFTQPAMVAQIHNTIMQNLSKTGNHHSMMMYIALVVVYSQMLLNTCFSVVSAPPLPVAVASTE